METMDDYKFAVDTNFIESDEFSYNYHILKDGKNVYTEETEADYCAAGYIILPWKEFDAIWKRKENALIGNWKEESDEEYEYALNVLPPVGWRDGGFYISEAYTGIIHTFHQTYNGKCYNSLQKLNTPRSEIMDSLKAFVEGKAA